MACLTVALRCTQITTGGSNRTDKQVSDLRKEQEQKMKRAKIQKKVCDMKVIPVAFHIIIILYMQIDEEERKKQARQKEQAENDKHKQQQREKASYMHSVIHSAIP